MNLRAAMDKRLGLKQFWYKLKNNKKNAPENLSGAMVFLKKLKKSLGKVG
jgi:hypothetical protein